MYREPIFTKKNFPLLTYQHISVFHRNSPVLVGEALILILRSRVRAQTHIHTPTQNFSYTRTLRQRFTIRVFSSVCSGVPRVSVRQVWNFARFKFNSCRRCVSFFSLCVFVYMRCTHSCTVFRPVANFHSFLYSAGRSANFHHRRAFDLASRIVSVCLSF